MNDRGLSLTPADMLKGYLLANITDSVRRTAASQVWKSQIGKFLDLGKDEDADGIKSWLRSQYAQSIREEAGCCTAGLRSHRNEFHRWVRDHEEALGLQASGDFAHFIEKDFAFYARQYLRLRQAARRSSRDWSVFYYNAQNNFTLQYPVFLLRFVSRFRGGDPHKAQNHQHLSRHTDRTAHLELACH